MLAAAITRAGSAFAPGQQQRRSVGSLQLPAWQKSLMCNTWRRLAGDDQARGRRRAAAAPPPRAQRQEDAVVVEPAEPAAVGTATSVEKIPGFERSIWLWEESGDAVRSYAIFAGILLAGCIPAVQENRFADLPYFLGLASMTIYIGAHRGLNSRVRQTIALREGLLAPVAASVSLFGLYLLLKYIPDLNIQSLLNAYFWLLGSIAMVGAFGPTLQTLGKSVQQPVWRFEVPAWLQAADERWETATQGDLAPSDLLSVGAALTLATMDAYANHGNFTINNLIACLIAGDILQLVGLKSFRVAAVLLLGMLAYDVFWVFSSPSVIGENVMLQVATSEVVTGPIRLLFPRIPGSIGEAAQFPYSLLGLGDVAIPGLLACLALRYDASRVVDLRTRGMAVASALQDALGSMDRGASRKEMGEVAVNAAESAYDLIAELEEEQQLRTQGLSTSGSTKTMYFASDAVLHQRTYFTPVVAAYLLGLVVAFGVNAVTHMGQPALLYLCPLTLGSVVVVAALRKDLPKIWSFTDTSNAPATAGPGKGGDGDGDGDAAAAAAAQQQQQDGEGW
ncbi:signal peptide peptidase [Micractinium conductrix]|uniref:Signal peptide peptidase n=1 Tax=Micractinium conductrix TaxID=554055 RepID=A0A2P6V5D2_9CHLO|nr:signal peptide peptidase [Micractinium conductrix]|eukprot:PSC69300.1 signal peptide peptidase [Micractinium conductrix]